LSLFIRAVAVSEVGISDLSRTYWLCQQIPSAPKSALADRGQSVHTPGMTLKNAALLALIGTILVTALLVWDLIFTVLNVVQGLVPPVKLFSSLIYAFGAVSVAVFFFVFHKRQS
jgi:hypothetical protein